jgi:hypothetical protein
MADKTTATTRVAPLAEQVETLTAANAKLTEANAKLVEENETLKADNELLEADNEALHEQIKMRGLQPEPPPGKPRHVPIVQEHGLVQPTDGATGRTTVMPPEDPKRPGPTPGFPRPLEGETGSVFKNESKR